MMAHGVMVFQNAPVVVCCTNQSLKLKSPLFSALQGKNALQCVLFEAACLCGTVDFSAAFEHSVLRVWEIYALENVVFCIAVYGPYKP